MARPRRPSDRSPRPGRPDAYHDQWSTRLVICFLGGTAALVTVTSGVAIIVGRAEDIPTGWFAIATAATSVLPMLVSRRPPWTYPERDEVEGPRTARRRRPPPEP